MKTKLLLLITLCLSGLSFSQVQFWSDGFEDTGSPSSGTRTPSMSFYATNERYFDRVTPAQVNWTEVLSGHQGEKFWGGADIDNFTGPNTQSPSQSITWSSINISGKTGLSFSGLFAIGNTSNFDHFPGASPIDHMIVEYRIDGGAWNSLVRFFPNIANSGSGALALETTGDSLAQGEGPALTGTFSQFGATIVGTGTLLDLRFKCLSNGTAFEEIAIDNLRLFETASCTAPVITSNPPNRTICVGNNTTFTSSATGATAYQWQVNTGSGFTNISNGGVYSNTTTSTLTITGALPTMSGYLYRCVAINGVASCFTNSNSGTLTISNISTTGAQNNVSCFGGSNGSAAVNASGGISPYTYSWSPSGGTGSIATGLSANVYTVTVTDNIGCVATRNYTIAQPTAALSASTGGGSTNVSCFGGSNGTATVSPTGGTAPYTYSWSPSGGTGSTASGLASGTYTVTVTDNNSCQTTRTFTVNQPSAALSASTGGGSTNISCFGGSNGTATVSPTGGTAPYTYSWSPSGGTGATASGLSAGTYTVTVTDDNTCQTTRTFTLTQPSILSAIATATDVSCFGGSNGTATVSPTGGTAPYTYSWSPSGGISSTASGLTSGIYTVTIIDDNTCQTTQSITVNQPLEGLLVTTTSTDALCDLSNGTATVLVSGGTAPYSYSWSPSGGTGSTASGLSSGIYTVTVTDDNTCETSQSVTISDVLGMDIEVTSSMNVSCNGLTDGSATIGTVSGGTQPYTYDWSGNPTGNGTNSVSGLAPGPLTCTITDDNGCSIEVDFEIFEPAIITGTDVQSACGTYTWANQTFTLSGQYMGVFQASNGCDSTVTLDLTIINIPMTTITDNGDASITSSNADEYQWIDCVTNMEIENATDQVFFPATNGSYAVVAVYGSCVDTSDCVLIDNVSITELGMNSWNIYPNPTNGIVTIFSMNETFDLQVFDLQGKQLYLKQIDDHIIDFSEYQSGMYVVKLIDGNGNVFVKRVEKLN